MIFPGKKSVTFSQLRHQLNLKSHYRSDSDRLESEFSKVMSNRSSQLSASNVLKQKNTLENDSGELNEGKCNLLNNCDYYTSSQTFPTSSRMDSSSGSRLPLLNHCLETPDHKKYDLNKMKLNSRLPFERVILIDR